MADAVPGSATAPRKARCELLNWWRLKRGGKCDSQMEYASSIPSQQRWLPPLTVLSPLLLPVSQTRPPSTFMYVVLCKYLQIVCVYIESARKT